VIQVVDGKVTDKLRLIHRAEWPLSNRATRVIEHLRTRVA